MSSTRCCCPSGSLLALILFLVSVTWASTAHGASAHQGGRSTQEKSQKGGAARRSKSTMERSFPAEKEIRLDDYQYVPLIASQVDPVADFKARTADETDTMATTTTTITTTDLTTDIPSHADSTHGAKSLFAVHLPDAHSLSQAIAVVGDALVQCVGKVSAQECLQHAVHDLTLLSNNLYSKGLRQLLNLPAHLKDVSVHVLDDDYEEEATKDDGGIRSPFKPSILEKDAVEVEDDWRGKRDKKLGWKCLWRQTKHAMERPRKHTAVQDVQKSVNLGSKPAVAKYESIGQFLMRKSTSLYSLFSDSNQAAFSLELQAIVQVAKLKVIGRADIRRSYNLGRLLEQRAFRGRFKGLIDALAASVHPGANVEDVVNSLVNMNLSPENEGILTVGNVQALLGHILQITVRLDINDRDHAEHSNEGENVRRRRIRRLFHILVMHLRQASLPPGDLSTDLPLRCVLITDVLSTMYLTLADVRQYLAKEAEGHDTPFMYDANYLASWSLAIPRETFSQIIKLIPKAFVLDWTPDNDAQYGKETDEDKDDDDKDDDDKDGSDKDDSDKDDSDKDDDDKDDSDKDDEDKDDSDKDDSDKDEAETPRSEKEHKGSTKFKNQTSSKKGNEVQEKRNTVAQIRLVYKGLYQLHHGLAVLAVIDEDTFQLLIAKVCTRQGLDGKDEMSKPGTQKGRDDANDDADQPLLVRSSATFLKRLSARAQGLWKDDSRALLAWHDVTHSSRFRRRLRILQHRTFVFPASFDFGPNNDADDDEQGTIASRELRLVIPSDLAELSALVKLDNRKKGANDDDKVFPDMSPLDDSKEEGGDDDGEQLEEKLQALVWRWRRWHRGAVVVYRDRLWLQGPSVRLQPGDLILQGPVCKLRLACQILPALLFHHSHSQNRSHDDRSSYAEVAILAYALATLDLTAIEVVN